MSRKITINSIMKKIWQKTAYIVFFFILYSNQAHSYGPVINNPFYDAKGNSYTENDFNNNFGAFQTVQQQLGCLMVPHSYDYYMGWPPYTSNLQVNSDGSSTVTSQDTYANGIQYCVDSNPTSSYFSPQINLRSLHCLSGFCHYDVTTFSNLYGQCLNHAGFRYCLRIAAWCSNGNSDAGTGKSNGGTASNVGPCNSSPDNLLLYNPNDSNTAAYGLYQNSDGSFTIQTANLFKKQGGFWNGMAYTIGTNLLPLYPQLVSALNADSKTPYLPGVTSATGPKYWGDQVVFSSQNLSDNIAAYTTLGQYARACIYLDPLDGTDKDFNAMGFHYLTTNANSSYSNAQNALLFGILSPAAILVAGVMALADLIDSKINQVVIHQVTSAPSGTGPIGCIDVPAPPGPPPFCNPMEIIYATPLVQPVCEASQVLGVSAANPCVTTAAICNLPNTAEKNSSCSGTTTNGSNTIFANSQNTALARVTYDSVLPNCVNLQATNMPCVNFKNLNSLSSMNLPLPGGLSLTIPNILHVYYNDILPVCTSGSSNPCISFSNSPVTIPQPGNGGYRIAYAINQSNSNPPYNAFSAMAGASGVQITSNNIAFQGSFVDWVNVSSNSILEIVGIRNADYFDLSCQFNDNGVCTPTSAKKLMDPSSIKNLSSPNYVSYYLTTNPNNQQQLCVYQTNSDGSLTLPPSATTSQVGCVPNPAPEPPIVTTCNTQICSPANSNNCTSQSCTSTHTNPAIVVVWGGNSLQSKTLYTNAVTGNGNQPTSINIQGVNYTTMAYDNTGRNWSMGTSANKPVVSSNYDNVGTNNTTNLNFPAPAPVMPAPSSAMASNYSGGKPTLSASTSVNDDYNNTVAYTTMDPASTPIGFVDSNGRKNLSGYLNGIEFTNNGQYVRGATFICLEGFPSQNTTLIKSTQSNSSSYDPADVLPLSGNTALLPRSDNIAGYTNYSPYTNLTPAICYTNRALPSVPANDTSCNSCSGGGCSPSDFDTAKSLQTRTIDNSSVFFNESTRAQTGFEMNAQYQLCIPVPQPTCAATTDSEGNTWPETTAGELAQITCLYNSSDGLYRKCYANGDDGIWGAVFNAGTFAYGGQLLTAGSCPLPSCSAVTSAPGYLLPDSGTFMGYYNFPATGTGQMAEGSCAYDYVSCQMIIDAYTYFVAGGNALTIDAWDKNISSYNVYGLCGIVNGNIGIKTYDAQQDQCVYYTITQNADNGDLDALNTAYNTCMQNLKQAQTNNSNAVFINTGY